MFSEEYIQRLEYMFQIILEHINKYYHRGNELFLIPAIICVVYMLIFEKEVRKKYIIPLITLALVIINPILYDKVYIRTYMYWRLFWVFSLHIIFATTFISISNRLKNDILRILLFAVACFAIISYGKTTVYETGGFTETVSLEKLPPGVVEVAEVMLELEEEPKAIVDYQLNVYLRQCSGKIKQMYGRNIMGHISHFDGEVKEVYDRMVAGEYDYFFDYAHSHGYQFLINDGRFYPEEVANNHGYALINNIGDYHIFYYVGIDNIPTSEGE